MPNIYEDIPENSPLITNENNAAQSTKISASTAIFAALGLAFFYLVANSGLQIFLGETCKFLGQATQWAGTLAAIITALLYWSHSQMTLPPELAIADTKKQREKTALSRTFVLIFAGATLCIATSFGYNWVIETFELVVEQQHATKALEKSVEVSLIATFLRITLAAPLGEEIIFRGILQRKFHQGLGAIPAIIISGLIFSLIHMDWAQFLPLAIMGWIFGSVYALTGRLWASILVHALTNIFSLCWMLKFGIE